MNKWINDKMINKFFLFKNAFKLTQLFKFIFNPIVNLSLKPNLSLTFNLCVLLNLNLSP